MHLPSKLPKKSISLNRVRRYVFNPRKYISYYLAYGACYADSNQNSGFAVRIRVAMFNMNTELLD